MSNDNSSQPQNNQKDNSKSDTKLDESKNNENTQITESELKKQKELNVIIILNIYI